MDFYAPWVCYFDLVDWKVEFCRASLRSLPAEKYLEVEAKALCEAILCGEIFVDDERLLTLERGVEILWKKEKYVGRGGYSLRECWRISDLSPQKLVCIDAGVLTGGFMDCFLRCGAFTVHAVDVGITYWFWKLKMR